MRVKKYRAADRATALKQIRAEMGSDAVILQEQRVRSGPMGLFGKPEIEILAAIEDPAGPVAAAPATHRAPRHKAARAAAPAAATTSGPVAGAGAPAATGSDDEVQMSISGAGRRAGLAADLATARDGAAGGVPKDGASALAAILAELPKGGEGLAPEAAARLADVIAQAADGTLDELLASTAAAPAAPATPAPARPVGPSTPAKSAVRAPRRTPDAPHPTALPEPAANGTASRNGTASGAVGTAGTGGAGGGGLLDEMQRTLADLRVAVDRMTRQSQPTAQREAPALRQAYQRLMDQEMEPGLALELMGQVAEDLGDEQDVALRAVQDRLRDLVKAELPVKALDNAPAPINKKRPHVVVLVGPTGVGKTTTVAKLAAHLSLQDDRRVCLVTTDTFRIAAAAQLGTYADIMRLPLEVVYAADELPAAIGKHADADLVIVDTPGCGQHNEPQLRELASYVTSAVEAAPHATVLLAVSAPTKLSDMLEVEERFGQLPLDGLILTKLDETRAFGPLLSLARRAGKPIYYVTTGQNVPNDIEPASADHLARMLVGQAEQQENEALDKTRALSAAEAVR